MKSLSAHLAVIPYLVIVLIATPAPSVWAITLEEAIETALEDNPGIKSQEAGSNSAKYMSDTARAGLMPELDIVESYTRTNNPMYAFGSLLNQEQITQSDFEPARLNNPDTINNFQTSIRLSQPLFTGGRLTGEIGRAESFANASLGSLAKSRQELTAMVIEAWLNLNLLRERKSVLSDSVTLADENLAIASDRVELGLALQSDILDMTIQREKTRQELNETVAAAKTTLSVLKSLLGITRQSPLTPEFGAYRIPDKTSALDSLRNEAMVSRPDLKAMNAHVQMARNGIRIAKSGYLPEIGLVADYSLNQGRLGSGAGDSWQFGVTARWNIFNGGKDHARIKAAAARLNEIKHKKEALKREIEIQVERNYYKLQTVKLNLGISKKQMALAKESLRITSQRFEQGLETGADILASETQYKKAQLNYLTVEYMELVTSSLLDLAIGRAGTSIVETIQ
jgi:outer membrane protein TolC